MTLKYLVATIMFLSNINSLELILDDILDFQKVVI